MNAPTIHPSADVQTEKIGEGTRIWQNCVVLKGAKIGSHCNICFNVFIENDVEVGDDVTIKSGVQLWDGVTLENKVCVGPNVTFTNDYMPRSKQAYAQRNTLVQEGASLGANSTIVGGITIGAWAMIGAGSVVTKDVPAYSLWYGNPARQKGYVCTCGHRLEAVTAEALAEPKAPATSAETGAAPKQSFHCPSCNKQYRMENQQITPAI